MKVNRVYDMRLLRNILFIFFPWLWPDKKRSYFYPEVLEKEAGAQYGSNDDLYQVTATARIYI
jgi:hypothetical protein